MKKHIRILIVFLAMFLSVTCLPEYASAKEDLYIPDWTVYASLKENGDLEISEIITFEFNEEYNGVYRNIILDEAHDLSDISVKEASSDTLISYERVKKAKNGDEGVFTIEKENDNTTLKIYSPSKDEIKTFKLSYVVNNAAVKYNDTGELYYKFLGKDNETSIENFTVYINLPDNEDSDRVKAFAHGPLNGKIYKSDSSQYPLQYMLEATHVKPGTYIEARILFPPEYIPESANIKNTDRYQEIVNKETALQKKKEEENIRKEADKKLFNEITVIAVGVNLLVFIIIMYLSRRKIDRDILMREYHNIPEDCTPAVASYITGRNINGNIFFATVLDLFNKGYLRISRRYENDSVLNNNDYIIYKTKNSDASLLPHEGYFMRWLFNDLGDGESVSLKDIEYYSKHKPQKFYESIRTWKSMIKNEAEKRGYFEHKNKVYGTSLILLSLFNILLGVITLIYKSSLALLNCVVAVALMVYGIYLLNRLSDKGYIQSKKWKSFIRYMKEHITELPEDEILNSPDKSLIYSLGFDVFKKQFLSFEPDLYSEDNWILWYILFVDSSRGSFSDSINNSFAVSSFTSDGSFTGGGGDGIGGGGAGGF